MKKVCLFVMSHFIWIPLALSAQQVDIYTYDVLPPYAYHNEQGELTGVYIEIVKTAISRMPGYIPKLHVVPWSRAKKYAESGRAFAILPPYFHAHDWLTDKLPKRPYIWPYSLPLYTQQDSVVCNAKSLEEREYHYPGDFEGLSFVMWRGDGRAGEAFNRMIEEGKIEIKLVDSIKDTIRLLAYGRIDCTVTSRLPFAWYLNQFMKTEKHQEIDQSKRIKLKAVSVVSTNEGYLGYTDIEAEKNFPFKKDFAIKFDIEIYKMRKSGEIHEIVNRFVDLELIENIPLSSPLK